MARTDITETVTQILRLGGTEAQIRDAGPRITLFAGTWYADNAASLRGIESLLADLQTPSRPTMQTTRRDSYAAQARRDGASHGVRGEVWDH